MVRKDKKEKKTSKMGSFGFVRGFGVGCGGFLMFSGVWSGLKLLKSPTCFHMQDGGSTPSSPSGPRGSARQGPRADPRSSMGPHAPRGVTWGPGESRTPVRVAPPRTHTMRRPRGASGPMDPPGGREGPPAHKMRDVLPLPAQSEESLGRTPTPPGGREGPPTMQVRHPAAPRDPWTPRRVARVPQSIQKTPKPMHREMRVFWACLVQRNAFWVTQISFRFLRRKA